MYRPNCSRRRLFMSQCRPARRHISARKFGKDICNFHLDFRISLSLVFFFAFFFTLLFK